MLAPPPPLTEQDVMWLLDEPLGSDLSLAMAVYAQPPDVPAFAKFLARNENASGPRLKARTLELLCQDWADLVAKARQQCAEYYSGVERPPVRA